MHLWEHDHPYYMSEGCFHETGHHQDYDSWDDFLSSDWADSDHDLNLVVRWDWHEHSEENRHIPRHQGDDSDRPGELRIHFLLQRKPQTYSVDVAVTRADEGRVRAWLALRAETMRAIWAPLLDTPAIEIEDD